MSAVNLTTIATAAAQLLGVLDSGESLSSAQLSDALNAMNYLLLNWAGEQIMVPTVTTISQLPLTAGTSDYAMGASAVPWIVNQFVYGILSASVSSIVAGVAGGVLGSNTQATRNTPIKIISVEEFESLPERFDLSPEPKFLCFIPKDWGISFSTAKLAPIPSVTTASSGTYNHSPSVEIVYWSYLTTFADNTTTIDVNQNYLRLMTTALALELAPQYDVEPRPQLLKNYEAAMALVRSANSRVTSPSPMGGDAARSGAAQGLGGQ